MARPHVAVMIPYKPTLHVDLYTRMCALSGALPAANPAFTVEVFRDATPFPKLPGATPWENVSRARNHMLDTCLRPEHDWVLWIDSDVTAYAATLLSQLFIVNPTGITAPLVLIEDGPSGFGGLFYDVAAFVEQLPDGTLRHATNHKPFFLQDGALLELECVGCVLLVPAALYHDGVRHEDHPDSTDHWPVCQAAKRRGLRVVCNTNVVARHADLIAYGEQWHST